MFLAAAPYFQTRFQDDPYILANSQSAVLAVFTICNLLSMLVLTNIQSSASYPFRITAGLLINAVIFALLTVSTSYFLDVSAPSYLAFLLLMVGLTACTTGMIQNGAFAFAASFGRSEYTQAIMAGQGVAGILPPLAQMVSFLAFAPSSPSSSGPDPPGGVAAAAVQTPAESAAAAFVYFLTAVLISALTVVAFIPLLRRHSRLPLRRADADGDAEDDGLSQPNGLEGAGAGSGAGAVRSRTTTATTTRRFVSMTTLLRKLRWVSASVFVCFALAMFFPVFTAKILSVNDDNGGSGGGGGISRLFAPGAFIPLGFFFWNLGDLAGRVATILPFSLRHRPKALFAFGLARVLFLPLYLLCNLHGEGAVVKSDLFYLLVVQFPFGLTNGWLGSSAMMAAGEWVADDEREAAGGFMSLCLVAGLAAGSLLSFTAAGV
jgi:equilibrative nucleoside transporter 1/2/3